MECKNDLVTVKDSGDKINKSIRGSTFDVPVTTSKRKSNAQKCKEYREKKKLNTSKEKKPVKSRAQINKTYYEKNKISNKSRGEYMKEYRKKKKFEKQILHLKQILQLQTEFKLQQSKSPKTLR